MRPLSPDSPRRLAAARFGSELRKAMATRNASSLRLAEAVGSGTSSIAVWKAGDNLPRTDTAARLADALDWPKLVELARAGRSGACARCGRSFVNEGGGPKRYCSSDCREVDAAFRERTATGSLYDAVKAEVERVSGTTSAVSRRVLSDAMAEYRRAEAKRQQRSRTIERQLAVIQTSVDAMCASCEPLGVCRTPECALRPVSPLPEALRPASTAEVMRPALGPHHPDNRAAWLASVRAGNARRWSRPDERKSASVSMRARYAAETPDQKAARIQKVVDGKARARTGSRR